MLYSCIFDIYLRIVTYLWKVHINLEYKQPLSEWAHAVEEIEASKL